MAESDEAAERPLETGWLDDTPIEDNLMRAFVHNQADANEIVAIAAAGRIQRLPGVFLSDAMSPIPYYNQAVLSRPVMDVDDALLDEVESFFGPCTRTTTLLSMWPTPDLGQRGWHLVGHPAFVVRSAAPVPTSSAPGVEVRVVKEVEELAIAERIAIEGYPIEEARDEPPGAVLPAGILETDLVVRTGLLDGEPVAIGNALVEHGVVNLCLGATLPRARRRGVWEALVWARLGAAPELPAVAYTSDHSRPGFVRMGFVPVSRFTLWARPGGAS